MDSLVAKLPYRYLIKLHCYPIVARIMNKCGVRWSKLGQIFGVFTVLAQAKKLVDNTAYIHNHCKPLDIIMLTMLGGHYFTINIEILLGIALRKKGHRIRFVLDDQKLPINEHHHIGKEKEWAIVSAKDFAYGKKYLKTLGFEVLLLSELIKNKDKIDIARFEHILESSLLKHYRVGVLDSTLNDLVFKKELVGKSIHMTARLGEKIAEMKPDRVIMSHGIYSTWGPAREILNDYDIPVVTYAETKKKDTIKLNWKKASDVWDVDYEWDKVKSTELLPREELKIDNYLKSRVNHVNDVMIYNFGNFENREKTLRRFNINPKKPVFSLFTNVLWDAASAQKELVFANPIDWVYKTIQWFSQHPEKQLIIKIHPAEQVIGTKQPFSKIIDKRFATIPDNIRIIKPHEKVNSWSIYNITDLGLVHTSTPGLELPLLGKPCVVVSDVYFRNKGFTIDVNNQSEYFSVLENFIPGEMNVNNLKLLSKRYAYLIFERYSISFPFIKSIKNINNVISFKVDSIDEFVADERIKFIVSAIENKSSFVP